MFMEMIMTPLMELESEIMFMSWIWQMAMWLLLSTFFKLETLGQKSTTLALEKVVTHCHSKLEHLTLIQMFI